MAWTLVFTMQEFLSMTLHPKVRVRAAECREMEEAKNSLGACSSVPGGVRGVRQVPPEDSGL